jgi:uncharacterized protein (DUF58 family)
LEAAFDRIPTGLWQPAEDPGENRLDRLLGDEAGSITLHLRANKRGAYDLGPVYAGSTFPFGILRLCNRLSARRRLLVTPRIHPIRTLRLQAGHRYQPGGMPLASRIGESLEFLGVREYREGDSLRKIHWKLWARRGEPVVREYSQEYFSRVGLIFDTFKPGSVAIFEGATEVAGSITNFLAQNDAIVDFFAAGETVYRMSAGRQLGTLQSILDLLSCVEPSRKPHYRKLQHELQSMLFGLSAVVVVTFKPQRDRLRFYEELRLNGVPLRIFAVGEGRPDPQAEVVPELHWIDLNDMPGCLEYL